MSSYLHERKFSVKMNMLGEINPLNKKKQVFFGVLMKKNPAQWAKWVYTRVHIQINPECSTNFLIELFNSIA